VVCVKIHSNPRQLMTQSPLQCLTSIVRSSALVQASSSSSMVRTRNLATGLTTSKTLFSPFFRAIFKEKKTQWHSSSSFQGARCTDCDEHAKLTVCHLECQRNKELWHCEIRAGLEDDFFSLKVEMAVGSVLCWLLCLPRSLDPKSVIAECVRRQKLQVTVPGDARKNINWKHKISSHKCISANVSVYVTTSSFISTMPFYAAPWRMYTTQWPHCSLYLGNRVHFQVEKLHE